MFRIVFSCIVEVSLSHPVFLMTKHKCLDGSLLELEVRSIISCYIYFFHLLCSTGIWTWVLKLARQAFHHLRFAPSQSYIIWEVTYLQIFDWEQRVQETKWLPLVLLEKVLGDLVLLRFHFFHWASHIHNLHEGMHHFMTGHIINCLLALSGSFIVQIP
jgi:hypothetical protein